MVNGDTTGLTIFIILDLPLGEIGFPSISITQCYVMVMDETRDAEGECDVI